MSKTNGKCNERSLFYYRRLARVRSYVQENFNQEITLDKAAKAAAMEATYFATFFREKVGISFFEWLRRIRIEKAADLLARDDLSVSEVAFEVGFGSIRTFERVFKATTGMTPSAAKRRARRGERQIPSDAAKQAV